MLADIEIYLGAANPADILLFVPVTFAFVTGKADGAATASATIAGSISATSESDGTATIAATIGGGIAAAGEAD